MPPFQHLSSWTYILLGLKEAFEYLEVCSVEVICVRLPKLQSCFYVNCISTQDEVLSRLRKTE